MMNLSVYDFDLSRVFSEIVILSLNFSMKVVRPGACLIDKNDTSLFQVRMMLIMECNRHSTSVAVFDANDRSGNNKNK
jgi:hypothetical protein